MAPKDFYAVHKGRETGLFYSWSECERQIKCYPGQSYKGFSYGEEEQARYFVKHGYEMGPPTKWCPVDTSTKSSGIYTSWIHAQEAIKNVSNASYRSLSSLDAAKLFLINRGSTPLKSKSLNRHSFRNTTTSNQSRGSLLTTNFNALRYPKIGNLVQKNTARSSPVHSGERCKMNIVAHPFRKKNLRSSLRLRGAAANMTASSAAFRLCAKRCVKNRATRFKNAPRSFGALLSTLWIYSTPAAWEDPPRFGPISRSSKDILCSPGNAFTWRQQGRINLYQAYFRI